MKLLEQFLHKIRSLPEGARRIAFLFCSAAAVVVVFNVWMSSVSYKLGAIDATGGEEVVVRSSSVAEDTENELSAPHSLPTAQSVEDELSAKSEGESATESGLTIEGPLAGIADSIKSMGEFVKDYTLPLPEKEKASSFFAGVTAKIKYALEIEWNYLNGFYENAGDWAAKNILGIKIDNQ